MDFGHLATIRYFILFRAGLTGSGAVRTLARVVLFPFSLLYLILYAITVHFGGSCEPYESCLCGTARWC